MFAQTQDPYAYSVGSTGEKSVLSGALVKTLKNDPKIQALMTPAEKAAVNMVIEKVGTPDEKDTAAEYVLRALPIVKEIFGVTDTVAPILPSESEISYMMRPRFI